MAHILELVGLTKEFHNNIIVSDINLQISKNEFITLLGPSGSGKTTILRMIGGFETPTSGDILFNGVSIKNIPSHKRSVNTVFQKYALFPHMSVFENIAFGLKVRRVPPPIIAKKVADILKLVHLSGFEERYPQSLSGGQQQRIAIARALVNKPSVLLLDEPLGALDLKLRQNMQKELKEIQRSLGITFMFITHDQEEALSMSDRIVILNQGKIAQLGTPEQIYNDPENAFVADFIGESNILPGFMVKEYCVSFLDYEFECVDKGYGTEEIEVVLRPEDIDPVPYSPDKPLWGIVKDSIFLGVHYEVTIFVNNTYNMIVHTTDKQTKGDKISLSIGPDDIHVMRKTYDS